MAKKPTIQKALEEFVSAIDAVGGVCVDPKGYTVPVGDTDWVDLGEAYLSACNALDRNPKIVEHPEYVEDDYENQ